MSSLTQADREVFARIADYLIPEAEGMPSASSVGVPTELADKVLAVRHDLVETLVDALRSVAGEATGEAAAKALVAKDPTAFQAVTLVAAAGYYMSPITRQAMGYPGQESRPFDPTKTKDWLDDGLLQPVIDRGPIFRPAPR